MSRGHSDERKPHDEEHDLAVFLDFENLALGFKGGGQGIEFDIHRVLDRLVEKGKIVVKKAYADWGRYTHYKRELHEAGMELIEIPRRTMTGKNSADIRLCVDALDLSYSKEHIDTFAIISGDSDFTPLVSKLKENGRRVIGLAMKGAASDLLVDNCDEFIFYEDLERSQDQTPEPDSGIPQEKRSAFKLLLDTVTALQREGKEILYPSLLKITMKRKRPSFSETRYGYSTFGEMLEDAARQGLITVRDDERSGTLVVTGLGRSAASRRRH
ncbi:MAG: NYN domain-containing protein [candidate division WOR-3 bacterium]